MKEVLKSMVQLRDYQINIKDGVYAAWNAGHKDVLVRSPTGSGKAYTLCTLAYELAYQYSMPTCVLVHRKELVSQLCMTFADLGIEHNIIAQKSTIIGVEYKQRKKFRKSFYNPNHIITVVSVDTLLSRLDKYSAWLLKQRATILDECAHQLASNKWGKVRLAMPNAIGAGFTATPERLDKKGLGRWGFGLYDYMVEGPTVRYLIDQGFLSRYKICVPESNYRKYLEDDGDETKDYTSDARNYASTHSQITGDIVKTYHEQLYGKQNLVFVDSIEVGHIVEKKFIDSGVRAKFLSSDTPDAERAKAIEDFSNNDLQVLINVDLFDEGFDCLSEDTEILTPEGWVNYNTIGDNCYGWDHKTGRIKKVKVLKKGIRNLKPDEKMWTVKSQHADIKVTEGHRIYLRQKNHLLPDNMSEKIHIETAKQVHEKARPFAIPLNGCFNFEGLNLSNDELKLLGWYMTDGWIENKTICISQTKEKGIIKIRKMIEGLGWDHSERIKQPNTKHCYKNSKPNTIFRLKSNDRLSNILHLFNKDVIHPDLHRMTREQFKIFWESLLDGDGTRQGNKSGTLTCARKSQADTYMQLAILRGLTPMCGFYKTKKGVVIYNLRVRENSWLRMTPKDVRGAKFELYKPETVEKVWCVTNELGTLITRRNGKVAILGNCPAQKGKRIIESVQMARPTKSLGKYLQICGRALRPVFADGFDINTVEGRHAAQAASYKPWGILVDHVGNIEYHGLACKTRRWTLDNIVRRRDSASLMRICFNITCKLPFDRSYEKCPYCGCEDKPLRRSHDTPREPSEMLKMVDGDMALLDPETIMQMEKEMNLENPYDLETRVARVAGAGAAVQARKRQQERIDMQRELAVTIAKWCGQKEKDEGLTERRIKKLFYLKFEATIPGALSLPRVDMLRLNEEIKGAMW